MFTPTYSVSLTDPELIILDGRVSEEAQKQVNGAKLRLAAAVGSFRASTTQGRKESPLRMYHVWYEIGGKRNWVSSFVVCPNSGVLYTERMIPVRIACGPNEISKIASMTCEYYDQLAVMHYKISDFVVIKERENV